MNQYPIRIAVFLSWCAFTGLTICGPSFAEPPPLDGNNHWAYLPPGSAAVPFTAGSQGRNPIDLFVASKLAERHLAAAPEADRRILIRRLHFDLL
jgi:hypothetical protein